MAWLLSESRKRDAKPAGDMDRKERKGLLELDFTDSLSSQLCSWANAKEIKEYSRFDTGQSWIEYGLDDKGMDYRCL